MDRSIMLSILGLLLIIAVMVNTSYFSDIAKRWMVDPTLSMVNTGVADIHYIIKPPETRVISYQDKSIILLDNMSKEDENALLTDGSFRNALDSEDRLLLYTSKSGLRAVVASSYFNDAEVEMLKLDGRVTEQLEENYPAGIADLSYINVSDPTNARIKLVPFSGMSVSLLIPYDVTDENFSVMSSSGEFYNVVGENRLGNKTLLLYHPSNSSRNIIIPVNYNSDEVQLLAKNLAVKTAMEIMSIRGGETKDLGKTQEFQGIDMAQLPYKPNTKIYVSFNIVGELGFLSQDTLVYMAIAIVAIVLFYVLYTLLVT